MTFTRFSAAFLALWISLAALPQTPSSGKPLCEKTLAALQAFCASRVNFSAKFRHTLKAVSLGQNEVEEGTVTVAPGARMRWQYTVPHGKLAVSDGLRTWLYLPTENQVIVQPLAKGPDAPLAVRLLAGQVDLTEEFICLGAEMEGACTRLTLRPTKEVPGLQEAEVWVGVGGTLEKVFYTDGMGNEISLEFSELKTGGGVDASLFRFVPPKGAKVIEAPAP